jgi:hypothetical protein
VALVRLAHPEADESPEAMLTRIERLERQGVASPATAPAVTHATAPTVTPAPAAPRAAAAADPEAASTPVTEAAPSGAPASRRTLGAVRRQAAGPDSPPPAPASPPPAPAPTPAPASPAAAFPTRDQLVQAWGDHILGRLRPKAKALYQAGRFIGVEDGRAVFGLPNEIHRTRCEEIRGDVEPALAEYFGQPVRLALVVDGSPPPVAEELPATPSEPSPPAEPPRRAPAPSAPAAEAAPVAPPPAPVEEDPQDLADFDESELGDVATDDHSAPARVLQAFPGAEEVR